MKVAATHRQSKRLRRNCCTAATVGGEREQLAMVGEHRLRRCENPQSGRRLVISCDQAAGCFGVV